jgi:LacI family transcriptional regulator
MVFLADLADESEREVCFGAAEYAAGRANLDFEPWPLASKGATLPTRADFLSVNSLLLTERACRLVFGNRARIPVPHVFFLAHLADSTPSVQLDDRAFGVMAAEHLVARGYRNLISIASASSAQGWSQLRANGFRQACRKLHVKCRHYELTTGELPVYWASNFERRRDKLQRILQDAPKPCGIFAANDVMAYFVIETARICGLGIPHEVAVIGVDDDPVPNAAAGLAISSIQPPFREVGRQAAALLDRLTLNQKVPRRVTLPPLRVVVRTSTDGFMVPNDLVRRAQAYIEERRGQAVRVGDVIRALRTTAVTLGKHFQRHLQQTPAEYILVRRIEHARELLRDGKLNVQQISEACGFHSCSYFGQIFKRVTGLTPGQVRRVISSSRS